MAEKGEKENQAARILVSGDVRGQFDLLFPRVQMLNEKSGPFTCLFCVGQFFAEKGETGAAGEKALKYLTGASSVPIPTYFIDGGGKSAYQMDTGDPREIAPNLNYLGARGIKKVHGLSVAYISGGREATKFDLPSQNVFTLAAAREVIDQCKSKATKVEVDVFLTSAWPKDIFASCTESQYPEAAREAATRGSEPLKELTKEVAPRFHFAAGAGVFFQRPAYKNSMHWRALHPTVFTSMAPLNKGNKPEDKWIYARSLQPLAFMGRDELEQFPSNCTENPFLSVMEKRSVDRRKQREEDAVMYAKRQQVGHVVHSAGIPMSTEVAVAPLGPNRARLNAKVTPNTEHCRIIGYTTEIFTMEVTNGQRHGKANEEAIGYLAGIMLLKSKDFTVESGHGSQSKVFLVEGISAETARKHIMANVDTEAKEDKLDITFGDKRVIEFTPNT